jgi:hypothetical protein
MFRRSTLQAALLATLAFEALPAAADDSAELRRIRDEIAALRQSYDARISELEARLKQAETQATQARAPVDQAAAQATQVAPPPAPVASAASNAFNPDISLILAGRYASLSRDPERYRLTGFIPGGEIGPGKRGFSLGESELVVSANIDPRFYGALTLALTPDDEAEVEEAFVQTTALPHGLLVKAGRFFSGIGYLNEQHAHTWDFVDQPLAYQAFLGNQFGDDGMQLRWVAPTETFLELGAELGRGRNFPGSDRDRNGAGAQACPGCAAPLGTGSTRISTTAGCATPSPAPAGCGSRISSGSGPPAAMPGAATSSSRASTSAARKTATWSMTCAARRARGPMPPASPAGICRASGSSSRPGGWARG